MTLGKNATPGRHLPLADLQVMGLHTIVPGSRIAPDGGLGRYFLPGVFARRRTGAAWSSFRPPSCSCRRHRPILAWPRRLSDGSPLFIDRKIGAGHALVFTSALDNIANNLPVQPVWLPFLDQTTHEMGGIGTAPGNYKVGSFVESAHGEGKGRSGRDRRARTTSGCLSLAESTKAHDVPVPVAGIFRYPPGQRPRRAGFGQCGPPRVRFRARPGGDAGIVEKYGYSLRSQGPGRPTSSANQRDDQSGNLVVGAGDVSCAGGCGIGVGKPAYVRRR